MQYSNDKAILKAVKLFIFRFLKKKTYIFLIFAQNKKAFLTNTRNLCLRRNKKKIMFSPKNLNLTE